MKCVSSEGRDRSRASQRPDSAGPRTRRGHPAAIAAPWLCVGTRRPPCIRWRSLTLIWFPSMPTEPAERCVFHIGGGNWYLHMCHFSRLTEVSSNLLGRDAWRGFNRNDSWRANNPPSRCLTAAQRSSQLPQVSAAKLEHHVFFQGLVIIVFPLWSISLSLSPSHIHFVSWAQRHSLTDIPITSPPIALRLAAAAPSSPLVFSYLGEGEWRGLGRGEWLWFVLIWSRSPGRGRERGGEKNREWELPPFSPAPTSAAAAQKQEPSNQSGSPQRLVQPARVLTHKLITSPSLNNGVVPGCARGVRMLAKVPFTP